MRFQATVTVCFEVEDVNEAEQVVLEVTGAAQHAVGEHGRQIELPGGGTSATLLEGLDFRSRDALDAAAEPHEPDAGPRAAMEAEFKEAARGARERRQREAEGKEPP